MSDGIYSALSGAVAQLRALDITANNVANAGTTGYRADRIAFGEALSEARGGGGPDSLRYVGVAKVEFDQTSGALRETGSPFDLALQGDGFFAVETPSGIRYTRAGGFVIGADGTLLTVDGHAVQGDGGPVSIPPETGRVTIARDGALSANGQELGRIRTVRFEDPSVLRKVGATLFEAPPGAVPEAPEEPQVLQGYLESANVNAVAGMNELIMISRSFDAFQRLIQTFRQLDERTAREVGSR